MGREQNATGDAAEFRVAADLRLRGFDVGFTHGGSRFDIFAAKPHHKAVRIQVKTAYIHTTDGVRFHSSSANGLYEPTEFDYFGVLLLDGSVVYVPSTYRVPIPHTLRVTNEVLCFTDDPDA